jgi:hypothetical protein
MAAGSRSALMVPVKLANCRPQEAMKGRGAPDHGSSKETQRDILLE